MTGDHHLSYTLQPFNRGLVVRSLGFGNLPVERVDQTMGGLRLLIPEDLKSRILLQNRCATKFELLEP